MWTTNRENRVRWRFNKCNYQGTAFPLGWQCGRTSGFLSESLRPDEYPKVRVK